MTRLSGRSSRLTLVACALSLLGGCGSNAPIKTTGAGGGSDAAAGGTSGEGGPGGTSATGGNKGGGAGSTSGPCPGQVPVSMGSCTKEGLNCEYGDDPDPWCHTYAFCQQGKWLVNPVSLDCPSTFATVCPTSQDAARDVACSQKNSWCSWGPGIECQCTDCRPGPIQPYCTGNPTWHCPQNSTDCPIAIPRAGSPCSTAAAGSYCEYACEFGARRCVDGYWTEDVAPCPMSTRAVKEGIRYLSPAELDRLAAQTEAMRLATYRYRSAAFGSRDNTSDSSSKTAPTCPPWRPRTRPSTCTGSRACSSRRLRRRLAGSRRSSEEVARLKKTEHKETKHASKR